MSCRNLALFLLIAFTSNFVFAGSVYKWVDDKGVVHYGDKRPKDQSSTVIKTQSSPGKSKPASTPKPETPSTAEQPATPAQAAEPQIEIKEKNRERCISAKKNLAKLENQPRVRISENGEYRFLSYEEILAKQNEMREIIAEECD